MFKRVFVALAVMAFAVVGLSFSPAQAAPSTKANQPTCFTDDSGSTCVRKGSAFTIVNDLPGEYGGVYVENQSLAGKSVSEISELGFRYSGAVSGGSPRYSIPIIDADTNDGYLFIDAASCNDGAGNVAPLTDPTCVVSGYTWEETTPGVYEPVSFYYESWAAFLAGRGAELTVNEGYAFIVADQPGTVTVSDVQLSRTPPGKTK